MPYPLSTPGKTSNMARSPRSPSIWPAFPGIPIHLEAHDERIASKSYGTTPTTPTTPEILAHSNSSYLSPAHAAAPRPQPSPSPVDPSPTTTIETSSDRSAIWPIPEPPPEVIRQQQTRRPLLRFFPSDRPRVRLDGLTVNTKPENQTPETSNFEADIKSDHGLGIRDGPPKPPSICIQPPPFENEKGERAPNIAQRIEQTLWNYNSSGNIVERWLLEIVSWLISAICMGSIIAVLIVLRDQPASKWPFIGIGFTLNAFVSVLSRIAGAALLLPVAEALGQLKWSWFIKGDSKKMWDFEMFDNASRGPWGALLLLIHTKGKTVAALGALVTIFALALDPFFQQLVSFPDRWTLQDTNSSIARAVRYEPHYPTQFTNGVLVVSADVAIQAAADPFFLDNGTQPMAFGNGTRADIPLTCPSGNCTWPDYDTLGMCTECVEATQLLDFTCIFTRVDWTSQLNATISSYPNATVCGYFLNATSAKPTLMSGYIVDDDGTTTGEALLMRTLPLVTNGARKPLYGRGSINFNHIRNPIADVLISSTTNGYDVYANKTPILHECVLTWCVKTVRSTYFMGTYQEEVVSTFKNTSQDLFPWSTYVVPGENIMMTSYVENITIAAPSTGQNFSSWGWGINNNTMVNAVMVFDRMFPAFASVANASSGAIFRWRTGAPKEVRTQLLNFNPWLLPNNITRHMERLGEAVTNVIRSSSSAEYVSGQAWDNEVYVEVRWGWLSLPVGLLIISCIFLLATVIKSAAENNQVSIRKNSAIATLLYGLPDHYQKRLAKSNSKGTPRARVKELKVRLSATRGWRTSGDVFSPLTPKMPRNIPPPGWI
jgi:hypothetical protein